MATSDESRSMRALHSILSMTVHVVARSLHDREVALTAIFVSFLQTTTPHPYGAKSWPWKHQLLLNALRYRLCSTIHSAAQVTRASCSSQWQVPRMDDSRPNTTLFASYKLTDQLILTPFTYFETEHSHEDNGAFLDPPHSLFRRRSAYLA